MKYHVYIIMSPGKLIGWPKFLRWIIGLIFDLSGDIDTVISTGVSPTLPTGYTTRRKIGEIESKQMDLNGYCLEPRVIEDFNQ